MNGLQEVVRGRLDISGQKDLQPRSGIGREVDSAARERIKLAKTGAMGRSRLTEAK